MNYQKIYNQLIAKRKSEIIMDGYCERHHIVPKSMGGDNSIDNLVKLTAREHFIAHWLLWRIYKNSSMAYALKSMRNSRKSDQSENKYINSIGYEEARKSCALYFSNLKKGRKESDETKLKKSIALKGRTPSENTIKASKNKIFTIEYRKKLADARLDKRVFKFAHKSGVIEKMRVCDFREKYNLCRKYTGQVVNKKRKCFKGWSIIE